MWPIEETSGRTLFSLPRAMQTQHPGNAKLGAFPHLHVTEQDVGRKRGENWQELLCQ